MTTIKSKFRKSNNGGKKKPSQQWTCAVHSLSRKFGWVCWYCGSPLTLGSVSLDHMVPLSGGGEDSLENLALCCLWCQYGKRAQNLDDFLYWIERVRAQDSPIRGI